MTGGKRLVVVGIVIAAIGGIWWAVAASARSHARDVADFSAAYGDPTSVSSVPVYAGVAVLAVGVIFAVAGVIAVAVTSSSS